MTRPRVLLHVGTPKSGTTYLQDLLWESRAPLAEAGVLYAGDSPAAGFLAAQDLLPGNFHGWRDPAVDGAWRRLVDAARAHPGTTVISHELLGDLPAEAASRAVAALDFAEVHVVVTARDLGRQLPAVWQEDVKNRHFLPFEELLELVRPGSPRPDVPRPAAGALEGHRAAFWLRQDVPAVLRRWGGGLPRDRVHVVTVPPSGSDPALLWRRFAQVVGVDPAVALLPDGPRNESLGRAESELLRRLNERLDYRLEWPVYGTRVTDLLGRRVLPGRRGAVRLTLPPAERSWVAARAEAMLDELAALDVVVTGDLDDLRVPPAASRTAPVTPGELLDVALDALIALIPVPTPPGAAPAETRPPAPPAPPGAAPGEVRPAAPPGPPGAAPGEARPPGPPAATGRRAWRPWRHPTRGRAAGLAAPDAGRAAPGP